MPIISVELNNMLINTILTNIVYRGLIFSAGLGFVNFMFNIIRFANKF